MIELRYYRYQGKRRQECATVTEAIALALHWEETGFAVGSNVERDGCALFPAETKPAVWARLWDEMACLALEGRGVLLPLGDR